jgi:hypothetical protein
MGGTPHDSKLCERVDEVLHYVWDPIGIAREPDARDEYHAYLPQAFSLLKSTTDGKDLEEFLIQVERCSMGLSPSHEKVREVVKNLLKYRDKIEEVGY